MTPDETEAVRAVEEAIELLKRAVTALEMTQGSGRRQTDDIETRA